MDSDLKQEHWVEPFDQKAPLLAGIDSDDQIYSLKQSFKDGKRRTIVEEISMEQLQQLKMMHKLVNGIQRLAVALIPAVLTGLSLWTRLRDIVSSNVVVWDEAHFGKFGSFYIKREFYFDVHPPLAKMLVALSGYLADFDGSFDFKSGEPYPDINYKFMRQFNAIFGVFMVPLAYYTAKEFRFSTVACTFAATMVLLDNAYLSISRFILLDSMLLSATCLVLFSLSKFRNQRQHAFSLKWWLWLAMTGVSIGTVSSMKWVGFFATSLVGLYTIEELWDLFGDLRLPKSSYLMHWVARVVCLIIIPFSIYATCFVAHFQVLNHTGTGDGKMSSLFQAGLKGSPIADNPLEIAYGSVVTIKHAAQNGALLHSHIQTFPGGSKQQQVTAYQHKDTNNNWKFLKPLSEDQSENEVQIVRHGDIVRLLHNQTERHLHSHPIMAPVTVTQWEVSGYGNLTHGDPNDEWIVEIVDEHTNYPMDGTLRSLTTRFLLRHRVLGCLLTAENGVYLPQWGFGQVEVKCDQRNRTTWESSIWNIEQHWNDRLPSASTRAYKTGFWKSFWYLNRAMMESNNGLIPDADKADHLVSSPTQWPFLAVGMRMSGWNDDNVKFYLMGNPIVWWSSALSLFVFVGLLGHYSVQNIHAMPTDSTVTKSAGHQAWATLSAAEWEHFMFMGKTLVGGWFLHFLPFCVMARVTYLHHYFPALYFTILLCSFLVDHSLRRASTTLKITVWGTAFTAVIASFMWFWPVSYGIYGPAADTMYNRQWRSAWNIIDNHTPATFM
ncbi:Protein O-mannosyltransferase 2 [Podila clonocystis]|nr:Protein O-mannosyltransferase 2 [Podila clonocystis]